MAAPRYVIAFITAGSMEEAKRIARALVSERLAACCNIVAPITSVYRWEGRVNEDPEILLIAKTRKSLFKAVVRRVSEIHSYDVPEIICAPLSEGSPPYLRWLGESTKKPASRKGASRSAPA